MQATGYWNATWVNVQPSFHECPRRENCQATNKSNIQPCLLNSDGPLCAVCLPDYFVDDGVCKSCKASSQRTQLAAFLAIFGCFLVIFHVVKKHAKKLYKKFGRDILRILTINLGFAQINSTLTSVINISWPTSYVKYVKFWDFVNFDFTSLLNLSCAGGDWDYRSRVAMASAVPFAAVALFAVVHVVQRLMAVAGLKKLSKTELTVISENIFDYMDKDGTGIVDEEEFAGVMKLIKKDGEKVNVSGGNKRVILSATNKTSMRDLGATLVDASMELSKEALVKAFTEQDFGSGDIGKRMLKWAELQRVRASSSAKILLVLFLLHAPVSQRIFHFFVCHDIAGKQFLRVDYSLSCTEDRYLSFQVVPILMLVIFTVGLPVVIFLLLFMNRKRLQTPSVRAQLGFLYAPFRPNAGEFWEVHELLRKLMLMGALVLIETTKVRMIVALLVCVVSVMSLNYFRPHKNGVVLLVAQASFLLTTFKYILAIVLDDMTEAERETLGLVLIFLDVCFVIGSVGSLFAVFYLLSSHVTKKIVVESGSKSEKVLASSSMTKVIPRSKKSLSIVQVRQAVVDEKVRIFETEHAKHHALALDLIQVRKLDAAARVQSRLEKRKNKKGGDSGMSNKQQEKR